MVIFWHGFVFVLLTFTICVTLTVQASPVVLDEILWYVVRRLGHVVSCGISVPTDYVTGAAFVFMLQKV